MTKHKPLFINWEWILKELKLKIKLSSMLFLLFYLSECSRNPYFPETSLFKLTVGCARATKFITGKAVLIFQHNHFGLLKLKLWLEPCPCIRTLFWSLTLPLFRLLNLNTKRKIGREHFLLEMCHSLILINILVIVPLNKHCKMPAVRQYCLKPYRPDF